ncbi:IclR family pca regulon transcriptional regulator [Rhodoblastus acidophilus]|uniref:IclR family transcriptional regulator n=1 Tax=Rhodoblastus acidophilus TaxID=1074 RepID=UPI002224894D|nr:IclR family transcriptional regulator [Rhodoblastus acidophilus]MCW2286867.1 IclR family pca regulon transcriptional regulator [Rhodoblastus acidophilus]MCW2335737.1 IclR family pca regulon transcriptional regulator [Rhodoblastus acidophilus]
MTAKVSTKAGVNGAKSAVLSLAKGFRVLEVFSEDHTDLTISGIAGHAGLDVGTAFRLLNTLVELGYLRRDEATKQFSLTHKAVELGFRAIGRRQLRAIARPALRRLVHHAGEVANFAVLAGADLLFIERIRAGLVRFGVDIHIGTTMPAHVSVIGQSILAFLSPEALERYVALSENAVHSYRDKSSPRAMFAALPRIRAQGYVFSASTLADGIRVLALPVLDANGAPIGAISITTPIVREDADQLDPELLAQARQAARDIAAALDGAGRD